MSTAAPLPSQSSAALLVAGEPLAILPVLAHAAGRGALVAIGACLAGVPFKYALRAGVAGAIVIEAFVIMHEVGRG
jgi:fatty acid desaturase